MKVVLDTNVFVSGLMFPEGVPGQIVSAWSEAEFEVVSSREQLAEIARVLAYPKIRRILNWDDRRIERFVERLYLRTEVVELDVSGVDVPRDPDDAPMLNTLIAADADFLVTGDRDLLVLNRRYPIETPSEFIRRL
ncbi:MAG: putative toxin-antitoxin system toxin component, PIN family [Gammaproteobacteria bacterium]|nr:putative toxin-antitoxin system toxin component, PIN family [Gammaproteobacteria bacterium]